MKKLFSIVLTLVMLCCMLPISALTVNASNEIDVSKHSTVVAWGNDVTVCDEKSEFLASVTGEGTEFDPYIIDTPEEFVYVINFAGYDSTGKYYKVSDDVNVFDFGAYDADASAEYIKDNPSSENNYPFDAEENAFCGTFDGNGLIVYGINSIAKRVALFPNVKGEKVKIKNICVMASYFKALGEEGAGIVGRNSASILYVENCAVINCCFANDAENKAAVGTVVGQNGYQNNINLTDIYVANNKFDIVYDTEMPCTGLIAAPTSYGHTFTNIVVVGGTPYTYQAQGRNYPAGTNDPIYGTAYTNVYVQLDPEVIKKVPAYDITVHGANGYRDLTNYLNNVTSWTNEAEFEQLGLSGPWIMTSKGPVLSRFHRFELMSLGLSGHILTCACGIATANMEHYFSSKGVCKACYYVCEHNYVNGICSSCNLPCSHNYVGGVCTVCSIVCSHTSTTHKSEIVSVDCTTAGIYAHDECDVCDLLFVDGAAESIEELTYYAPHNIKPQDEVPAQRGIDGIKAHDKCTVCGKKFIGGVEKSDIELKIDALPVYTEGWKGNNTEGWWYQYSDGGYATGWKLMGGSWYYFDINGWMQTGWQYLGGDWYSFNDSGAMATGWVNDGGIWYYMNASGAMVIGWVNDGGTWYYMSGSGAMHTGWLNLGGTWYYMNSSGAMVTGWQQIGGTWYYFYSGGNMATGWILDGSTWYLLDSSGAWIG